MIILHSRDSDRHSGDMWRRDTVQLGWYICRHSTWATLSNFRTQEASRRWCPISWATIALSLHVVVTIKAIHWLQTIWPLYSGCCRRGQWWGVQWWRVSIIVYILWFSIPLRFSIQHNTLITVLIMLIFSKQFMSCVTSNFLFKNNAMEFVHFQLWWLNGWMPRLKSWTNSERLMGRPWTVRRCLVRQSWTLCKVWLLQFAGEPNEQSTGCPAGAGI